MRLKKCKCNIMRSVAGRFYLLAVLTAVLLYPGCGTVFVDSGPCGIAADTSGNIYVTYPNYGIIKKFSSTGTLLLQWETRIPSWSLNSGPFGIAIWPGDGYVGITDIANGLVQFYTSAGDYFSQFGAGSFFNNAEGLAADSTGNVYVGDYGNNRVYIFKRPSGVAEWNIPGSGDGQFAGPIGIAVYSTTYVYVADYRNNRIQRFTSVTSTGTFSSKWGTKGSGIGEFEGPMGVAVDQTNGFVYVADAFNNRIQKFDLDGNYLLQWGVEGGGSGQFDRPQGVAVDPAGNVYVADTNNNRIQKFDSSGNYLTQWQ